MRDAAKVLRRPEVAALRGPWLALALWLDAEADEFDHEVGVADRVRVNPVVRTAWPEEWPASKFVLPVAVAREVLREFGDGLDGAAWGDKR